MSTNGDDPAGIQRENQDVKPRMTQSRLGSLAAPNVGSKKGQPSVSASSVRAANAAFSQRPTTSTPADANNQNKQPLFRPRDTQSPEASARAPIKLDDDDDSLWAELDAADPSFTQEAINIDERYEHSPSGEAAADLSLDTTFASNQDVTADGTNLRDEGIGTKAVASQTSFADSRKDVIDMSLDDDTEESVYMSGRSKRPRKVSCGSTTVANKY